MNSKSIFVVFVIINSIFATPFTYTLSGVAFDDGGVGTGSFVYDPSSSTCGTIDITTTPGTTLTVTAHYASDCIPLGASRILFPLRDPNNNNIITRYLSFQFPGSLDGSTVTNIDTTPNGNSYECNNCSPVRYITAGSVTTQDLTTSPLTTQALTTSSLTTSPLTTGVLTPSQFCGTTDQDDWSYGSGFYCASSAGFIQCYGDPAQGVTFNCPAGTGCQCDYGVECSNHGTQSPCTSI